MQIKWLYRFPSTNHFQPLYHGIFYHNPACDTVSFFYKQDDLTELEINADGTRKAERHFPSHLNIGVPGSWYLEKHPDGDFLICGELACKLPERQLLPVCQLPFSPIYPDFDRIRHIDHGTSVIGSYTVSHIGAFQLECKKADTILWKKKCKGYLYTDIIPYRNSILFGTAQWNGYFYKIDLSTGGTEIELQTGGTVGFAQEQNVCFLYRKGKKGGLLKLNLDTGTVCDSVLLPGQITDDCPIAKFGSTVYTFVWINERNGMYTPAICAIRTDE